MRFGILQGSDIYHFCLFGRIQKYLPQPSTSALDSASKHSFVLLAGCILEDWKECNPDFKSVQHQWKYQYHVCPFSKDDKRKSIAQMTWQHIDSVLAMPTVWAGCLQCPTPNGFEVYEVWPFAPLIRKQRKSLNNGQVSTHKTHSKFGVPLRRTHPSGTGQLHGGYHGRDFRKGVHLLKV